MASNIGNTTTTGNNSRETGNAQELVNDAVTLIKDMKSSSSSAKLLQEAKGLYIVPEFGRGAFINGQNQRQVERSSVL